MFKGYTFSCLIVKKHTNDKRKNYFWIREGMSFLPEPSFLISLDSVDIKLP